MQNKPSAPAYTFRLPSMPQHRHIRSTTRSLSPRPNPGSSTSRRSLRNPSREPPLRPAAHERRDDTPTIKSPRSLFDICSSFFGAEMSKRSRSLQSAYARRTGDRLTEGR